MELIICITEGIRVLDMMGQARRSKGQVAPIGQTAGVIR